MAGKQVKINRAPVLTLWAAVVAERQGHDREAALTLGKALAGLNAQSKGRRLGIFKEGEAERSKGERAARRVAGEVSATILGRSVPAIRTRAGLRATARGVAIDPQSVERYLAQKFGDDLRDVRSAMEALAKAFTPEELAQRAYGLYEAFRPSVPAGEGGWGAKGTLDLGLIRSLGGK
ncbi:MAG: hypothetical protein WAW06_01840 [bacterium]